MSCLVVSHERIETNRIELASIPIVKGFQDIFSKELLGLTPIRKIKVSIETLPGITIISQSPYRMTFTELIELKIQLQELWDKGFIQPNNSHWGAQVLFIKKKDGTLRLCIDYR